MIEKLIKVNKLQIQMEDEVAGNNTVLYVFTNSTQNHDFPQVQRTATQRGEEIKRLQGELERQQVIVIDQLGQDGDQDLVDISPNPCGNARHGV